MGRREIWRRGDGAELARRFGITQSTVSISVRRGEPLAKAKGLTLTDE
jgi:hypothetical protein